MCAKKILIADDEPDIVTVLKCELESEGYQVITSIDGKDALAKVLAEQPDLVILDVMMPKMNGWEVCKNLKTDEKLKIIPVIMLTAKTQQVDALMSFECGANEYLTKPFDFDEVSGIIKKLIGG